MTVKEAWDKKLIVVGIRITTDGNPGDKKIHWKNYSGF